MDALKERVRRCLCRIPLTHPAFAHVNIDDMGARFELRHANIIAYLTFPVSRPPRLRERELREFIEAMSYGLYDGSGQTRSPFLSRERRWPREMERVARDAQRHIDFEWSDQYLPEEVVTRTLSGFRDAFQPFALFALAVGDDRGHRGELNAMAEHFAYRSRGEMLVLIPMSDFSRTPLTVLDPLPSFALALEQRSNWPGFLFWSRSGAAAFAASDEAPDLFEDLVQAQREGQPAEATDEILRRHRSRDHGVRLLHLSDLHYGRAEAAENEALLLAHLDSVLDGVQRVVITGDLFDNPTRQDAIMFRNFRAALTRRSRKDPIVIPGNHDQKLVGNLPTSKRQIADLEWSGFITDDELQCCFYCFDSSRDANLARGRVTKEQMRDVATLFETAAVARPELRGYLPLALVHHHPFSFETGQETFVQRLLGKFGLREEQFLRMLDADQFLTWVAKRRIPLILHGHKHVQRHFSKTVDIDGHGQHVSAIGCGASLGAEGYPLSYNIVTWDQHSRTWGASFFADPGDGSGFSRQCITTEVIAN